MLIGVVGKANVGKSTFFKAATLANVPIGNYPFVTIKPNHGMGYVRVECVDKEFGIKCNPREGYCIKGQRFVSFEMLDVAGLVPGAHQGRGMGNQFLDDLRQADALIHVIDCSGGTSEMGEPIEPGSYDPANDIRFLEVELDMWYLQILKKPWEKFAKQSYLEHVKVDKAIAKQFSGLNVDEAMVKEIIAKFNLDSENAMKWSEEQLKAFAVELRRRTKPMIIAANKVDVSAAKQNIERLRREFSDYIIVPCSAESELALKEASKHELISYIAGDSSFEITNREKLSGKQIAALEFIKKNVIEQYGSTGVQQVMNKAVFELLGYIALFPVAMDKLQDQHGRYLPDCFLMPQGTTALSFAYRLHSDFGDKFIRAVDVKSRLTIGKDHVLKHRDVIEIISGRKP
ncbi:TPA: redox-regulated ATPase YchF [Candidatus Woesearchaeota archaeon]|nr:redox-regulated ATPase YchF [Candidatus Woesearchaeota archaeon]